MTWTRNGECNGCGECCRTVAVQAIVRDPATVVDRPYYDARGFAEIELDGTPRLMLLAKLVAPCPRLEGDRCGIYDDRPKTCRDFPTVPLHVVETPCSYWFESDGIRIGGAGSPYPATPATLAALEARKAASV